MADTMKASGLPSVLRALGRKPRESSAGEGRGSQIVCYKKRTVNISLEKRADVDKPRKLEDGE